MFKPSIVFTGEYWNASREQFQFRRQIAAFNNTRLIVQVLIEFLIVFALFICLVGVLMILASLPTVRGSNTTHGDNGGFKKCL